MNYSDDYEKDPYKQMDEEFSNYCDVNKPYIVINKNNINVESIIEITEIFELKYDDLYNYCVKKNKSIPENINFPKFSFRVKTFGKNIISKEYTSFEEINIIRINLLNKINELKQTNKFDI